MRPRIDNPVDIEVVELKLSDPQTPADLVDEYYKFGQLLVSELASRGAEVERKLITLMGWSIAAVGYLGFQTSSGNLETILTVGALVAAFSSAVMCAVGLRTRMWPVPSPSDWFKLDVHDGDTLKRYHVVSLLNMHQTQSRQIGKKADWLARGELLAIVFAVAIAALVAARLFA